MHANAIVSDDAELLVLVDADDQAIGNLDKKSCHDGDGVLHRAFSLFVFNPEGELLMQQRAAGKRLWPGYWSNSCCSHPRQGEDMADAVVRRSAQELGFRVAPSYLYKFEYQASFADEGSEHELCSVFLARHTGAVQVNPTEIDAWQWMSPEVLNQALRDRPGQFTPWFKLEWERLQREFSSELAALA